MKHLILSKRITVFILASIVITAMTGCGPSTKIEKSWREPTASITKSTAGKTLVMALVKDETSRRVIEDALVKRIGAEAVASYVAYPSETLKTIGAEKFNELLSQEKYKHVVLMRLADVEKETSYVPGTTTGFYGGYGRYYGYGYGMYSTPGYYTTDKNYFVETTVYSVTPDKLLWTGTTKTVNPSKIEKTVNDIADVVAEKMRSDNFLK